MKNYMIPFGAWYEPGECTLSFPDNWDITTLTMKDAPEITGTKVIEDAIDNPIGTPTLSELAKGKRNVAIAVDDISRSTRLESILKVVLKRLNDAGIPDDKVTIIAALGSHRPMVRQDFVKKLGKEILDRCNVVNHSPFLNLVKVGVSKLGTPVIVNKTYHDADLKIAVGGVVPHPLAGFGGGAKIVLPGICGIETLEANHSSALKTGTGAGIGRVTDLRLDIEDVCSQAGLDFSINVIFNSAGKNAGIFAGHYVQAHRKAMDLARIVYKTEIPQKVKFDVGFFNAFPEDTELSQFLKALNLYMLCTPIIDRKGVVVIMTAASEGRGYHVLQAETGSALQMRMDESNLLWQMIGRRRLALFSPNVTRADVDHFFSKNVLFKKDFRDLLHEIEGIVGPNPKACLFQNTLQLP
nr:nickel-dependent lactate racemase [Candidatus Sigynarchaeota archaeon]